MKNKLLLALLAGLLLVPKAQAYVSLMGNDPNVTVPNCSSVGGSANTGYPCEGSYDYEYKDVVRTQTTGYNDAIAQFQPLYYSQLGADVSTLQTVSLEAGNEIQGNVGTQLQVSFQACFAGKAIATGYNAAFQCQTRGPAYVPYSTTWGCVGGACGTVAGSIQPGSDLCIGSQATSYGLLIPCNSGVLSKIKALEYKAPNTTGSVHVFIDSE